MTDVLLVRQKIHGLAVEDYAAAIRERLPDREVAIARTPAEEKDLVSDVPVVSGRTLGDDLLAEAEDLRLFAGTSAGTDHLPLDEFEEREITVTNASGVHGPNIAEHVIGAILAFGRRFFESRRRQQARQWRALQARELAGSTVAVVGLGAIGQSIVERLEGFDVHSVGVRHSPEKDSPTDDVYGFDEIHEAVADAEYVALSCPLTDETEHLIDGDVLETMRRDAVLVNVARGPVVDTDALVGAIQSNTLRGAALDVTDPEPLPEDHPLWNFDNVFVTPHSSGHTPQYYDRCADILAENLRQVDETGEWTGLENQVVPDQDSA